MSASDFAALVVARRDSHLINAPAVTVAGYVNIMSLSIILSLFETRRRGHDALHETVFDRALFVKIDSGQIDNGLDLSVRLFTKDEKLAGNLNRRRNRRAFVRQVVIIRTEQYRQSTRRGMPQRSIRGVVAGAVLVGAGCSFCDAAGAGVDRDRNSLYALAP